MILTNEKETQPQIPLYFTDDVTFVNVAETQLLFSHYLLVAQNVTACTSTRFTACILLYYAIKRYHLMTQFSE